MNSLKEFLKVATFKIIGVLLFLFFIYLIFCFLSYNKFDSSINTISSFNISNFGGRVGATISELFFNFLGIYSFVFIYQLFTLSKYLLKPNSLNKPIKITQLYLVVGIIPSTLFLSYISYFILKEFPTSTGLGGLIGLETLNYIISVVNYFYLPEIFHLVIFLFVFIVSLICLYKSLDLTINHLIKIELFINKLLNSFIKLFTKKTKNKLIKKEESYKIKFNLSQIFEKFNLKINKLLYSISNLFKTKKISPIQNIQKPIIKQKEIIPKEVQEVKKEEVVKYTLPPTSLLNKIKIENIESLNTETNVLKAKMLEETLKQYGLNGTITNIRTGPVITIFEMEPGPGIKISQIKNLGEDIARHLQTISIRIAVIPGTNKIGLELPNIKRQLVGLRSQLESDAFKNTEYKLPISLGSGINGTPVFVDLSSMPHLLIAGTTGSGKSVGVNSMILSLLYTYSPDECKFIMIDPKMVEFSNYEDIPHLLLPIVIDPPKAIAALKWVATEMDERYQNMRAVGVKDITKFNEKIKQNPNQEINISVNTGFDPVTGEILTESKKIKLKPLPYIVVVVDELADLMQVARKDVEGTIARLAAKARAAGIHLIFSTQRPSVDVITGTIKSNFPIRISYQVASGQDSRTILDEYGAELMLGKGDMLYRASGGQTVRIHSAFVTESEITKVVDFIKVQAKPEYVQIKIEQITDTYQNNINTVDKIALKESKNEDLYNKALEIILTTKKTSISFLQRQLGIGFNKAATIIEKLEKEGILSTPDSTGKRSILKQ